MVVLPWVLERYAGREIMGVTYKRPTLNIIIT
jgi:hypothetical protein